MLRKTLIVAALVLVPSLAHAEDMMTTMQNSTWEFTLSGSGANDKDFETFDGAATGGAGFFLTKELELSVRQTLGYSEPFIFGTTLAAVDWNFDMKDWWPYAGANFGYQYGGGVNDAWVGGPEVGVRYFVNKTTFLYVQANYEFQVCKGLDQGGFLYTLGIGFWK